MGFYHRTRRLLFDAPPRRAASFDTNMVIILAGLLCALICALGINSLVRCILRCTAGMGRDAAEVRRRRFGRTAAIGKMPVAVYDSDEGVGCTECAICLGEFLDGEKIRVLPKCCHCFHVECVDVWLASHSSCPMCRQSLAEEMVDSGGGEVVDGGST